MVSQIHREAFGKESQGRYLGNESLAGIQDSRRAKRVTKSARGDASLFGTSENIPTFMEIQ